MLRRSSVRLRNAGSISLDEDVEGVLGSIADEIGLTRNDLIRRIVREWLDANAYPPVQDLDKDSDTEDGS